MIGTKEVVKVIDRIDVIKGDITKCNVDAIVNAANNSLLGGGGVDGAIHRAAGKELLEECRKLGGCETGQAKITKGYKLPAKRVIHTVGPIWQGGNKGEDKLLAACYRNSLELAVAYKIKTIAFPSISTGAYRFPVDKASVIAINEINEFLKKDRSIEKVLMVCFDENTYKEYIKALKDVI
ncbi:O-acetyl-ADP-ribose deacetylase [Defluviitalea phaphyphila]|uniref:O-acetyl-ADP-ribose deacetylase n=1 Tax=Defluviitalea phaphyphila TaxID=1473580 RepID=UPI002E8DFA58|nr:O-acetyl-ADP-ribose deacetylase [Defluviitalea phaphyphila]